MKNHWIKDFPVLNTDEDYYVRCAIEDVHLFIRNGIMPRNWKEHLELLDKRLNYFLGRIEE